MTGLVEGYVVELSRIDDDQVARDHVIGSAVYPNVHIGIKGIEIFYIFVIVIIFNTDFVVLVGLVCEAIKALNPAFDSVYGERLFGKGKHIFSPILKI